MRTGEKNEDQPKETIVKMKFGSTKKRIEIPSNKGAEFTKSLTNLLSLNLFKTQVEEKTKKIKRPTPKNPTSKKTISKKARIRNFKTKKVQRKAKRVEDRKKKEFLLKLAKGK